MAVGGGVMSSLALSHQDWTKINEVILNMNYERDVVKASKQFLCDIDALVPYEKATIIFFNYHDQNYEVDTFIEEGADENEVNIYKEYYCPWCGSTKTEETYVKYKSITQDFINMYNRQIKLRNAKLY
jgi:hypothetical protein